MELHINELTLYRIVIGILQQFVYESVFFCTELFAECIQISARTGKVFRRILYTILIQGVNKLLGVDGGRTLSRKVQTYFIGILRVTLSQFPGKVIIVIRGNTPYFSRTNDTNRGVVWVVGIV